LSAFVAVARAGTLRAAAAELHLTEQGVRNRLVALETRLGVELYRKRQGPRRGSPLTRQGREFLPHAVAFLDRARDLANLFQKSDLRREVHCVATEYLILYVLIGALRRFHAAFPQIHIWLSAHTEHQIETELLENPEVELGVAAPYESSPELEYLHLFSMNWSVITPRRHRLFRKRRISLVDLADEPLILFERGSTGRQHVADAFHGLGLSPRVYMETTNTEIIVRMVEAGLGVSIVPLLASGVVTRGHKVGIRSLGEQIRPIHSGVLIRRNAHVSEASRAFLDFLLPYGRSLH
jgi:DNA-binding transcriptional LysR family regulator